MFSLLYPIYGMEEHWHFLIKHYTNEFETLCDSLSFQFIAPHVQFLEALAYPKYHFFTTPLIVAQEINNKP